VVPCCGTARFKLTCNYSCAIICNTRSPSLLQKLLRAPTPLWWQTCVELTVCNRPNCCTVKVDQEREFFTPAELCCSIDAHTCRDACSCKHSLGSCKCVLPGTCASLTGFSARQFTVNKEPESNYAQQQQKLHVFEIRYVLQGCVRHTCSMHVQKVSKTLRQTLHFSCGIRWKPS
jgi:hypothetical protein